MTKIQADSLKTFSFAEEEDFVLESGATFGPVTVAYETFGKLNKERDNAILIIHALTGGSHVCSAYDKDDKFPGWWDEVVGPGKAIDTDKYCVVCSNCFGGCYGTTGPSSINPKTKKTYGLNFPIFTVKDMVEVQKRLLDHLKIKKLKSVIGASLAGMQVIEWSVLYPDMLDSAVVIASTYKTSPQVIGFGEVGRNAIMADPNFNDGNYYDGPQPEKGLLIARMVAHITYLSSDSMETKFGRNIKTDVLESDKLYGIFGPMFQVESYLRYQGKKFVMRFDANTYLYLTKAMDMYDLTRGKDNVNEVIAKVKARLLVISFRSDWHFRPEESWALVKALMSQDKEVSYVDIESPYGHDAFLIKNVELEKILSSFLNYRE